MGQLFDLKAEGYFYTRLQNPTNDAVAAKIADLEGGVAAILTSSGQAANFYAVFNICEAGDHVVAASTIYGGTFNLLAVTFKKLGIDCTFVDTDASPEEIAAAFRPNTKVLFAETIANPALTVLDIVGQGQPWFCKYICPVTVFLKPTSYFSLLRVKCDEEKCVSCGKCRKVCPMNVNPSANSRKRENATECILCLRCVEECPKKALKL